ncbi:hypothetical protein FGO68_gene837 [Halteria grandinella]|uniref:Uncharacterized protein n=1 Tax=Halteria grandinella TaxID=5974 RepID=A0A8J8P634_HALGN|nr:hypothetical protein FGO68_gene837 [Halteria grandinella]
MCSVLTLLTDYPGQQLQFLTTLSIFSTVLQIIVQPMASKVENAISLFNELMATFYLYSLIVIAQLNDEKEMREQLGLILISILLATLTVNSMKVFTMIGIEIVRKIRQKMASSTIVKKHVRNHANTSFSQMESKGDTKAETEEAKIEEIKEDNIKEEIKEEGIVIIKNNLRIRRRLVTYLATKNDSPLPVQQVQSEGIWAQEPPMSTFWNY